MNFPFVNLWENDAHVFVESELPGVSLDELQLLMEGTKLVIRGERRLPRKENGERRVLLSERGGGAFERRLLMPCEIDIENAEAVLRDGLLTIMLPKQRPLGKPRSIFFEGDNS